MTTPTRPAHTTTPVVARPATSAGALAGFSATCTCGLVMANTVASNVAADVREHMAWHAKLTRRYNRAMGDR